MASLKTYKIKGEARWTKILGAPPPGYNNGPAEWSIDIYLDKEGLKEYKISGGDPFYIKKNKETNEDYIKFVRKAIKRDGTPAKPIQVFGPDGKTEWNKDVLIGNGSKVVAKFSLNEVPSQGKTRKKPSLLALQVWEHSPYTGGKADFDANPESSNILEQGDDW